MNDHPAVEKLKRDLAWEGPGGRKQGQVVLSRDLAQSLVEHLDRLDALQGLLKHIDDIVQASGEAARVARIVADYKTPVGAGAVGQPDGADPPTGDSL